jgi:succinoglycan biosynthesis transport protein ExoP
MIGRKRLRSDAYDKGRSVNLDQLLRILIARWSIVVVAIASCFVGAFVVSQLLLPPRYEARSRVMLEVVKPDPVSGEMMANTFLEAYIATQAELIRDYQTTGSVVDQLGWASNPVIVERYAAETDGKGTDIRRWLAESISNSTAVQLIPGSNILEIIYSSTSPEAAREFSNIIRSTYIERSLDARRQSASRMADWYRQQGDEALRAMTAAEARLTDYARANNIVFHAGGIDVETSKLAALSTQTVMAETMPSLSRSTEVSPINTQLDTVNQQIAQAATTLGPNHPVFQSLQRQRQVLEAEAARQAAKTARASGSTAPRAAAQYGQQKARVIAQRDEIDAISRMREDIALKRDQYLKSMQRAADLRMEANATDSQLTPMGAPIAPEKPSFPNIPLILFGSLALGTALGVITALLTELLALRVRGNDDLEFAAGVPVVATIAGR